MQDNEGIKFRPIYQLLARKNKHQQAFFVTREHLIGPYHFMIRLKPGIIQVFRLVLHYSP